MGCSRKDQNSTKVWHYFSQVKLLSVKTFELLMFSASSGPFVRDLKKASNQFNQYIFQEWYEQELDDVNDELVEANEENWSDFKDKGTLQENLNALLCCIKVSMQFDVSSANLRSLCYKKNLEK